MCNGKQKPRRRNHFLPPWRPHGFCRSRVATHRLRPSPASSPLAPHCLPPPRRSESEWSRGPGPSPPPHTPRTWPVATNQEPLCQVSYSFQLQRQLVTWEALRALRLRCGRVGWPGTAQRNPATPAFELSLGRGVFRHPPLRVLDLPPSPPPPFSRGGKESASGGLKANSPLAVE